MIKLQKYALTAFMLLVPVAYWSSASGGMVGREFEETFFRIMGMCLVTLFVGNVWMTAFFIWSCFLFALNLGDVGSKMIYNIFTGIMIFTVSKRFFKEFSFTRQIRYIIILGALSAAFMVFQYFHVDPLHTTMDHMGRAVQNNIPNYIGLFKLKAFNAVFFALLVPVFASIRPWMGIIPFFPIYLCQSSAGILAASVGYVFYLFFNRDEHILNIRVPKISLRHSGFRSIPIVIPDIKLKKHIITIKYWIAASLIGVLLSGYYIGVKDFNMDRNMFLSRFGIWHAGIKKALQYPLGYGPDSWRNYTVKKNFMFMGDEQMRPAIGYRVNDQEVNFVYYDPDPQKMMHNYNDIVPESPNYWDNPHSEYVQLLFEFGIVGVFIFIMFCRDMVIRFMQSEKYKEQVLITSMLVVFAVAGTTQFPLHVARLACFFPIILGAFYAKTSRLE